MGEIISWRESCVIAVSYGLFVDYGTTSRMRKLSAM